MNTTTEERLEYYIMMLNIVGEMQYVNNTTEKVKAYYTKQINKCLEELNGK